MPLADRLNAARHRQFVGRTEELALFESALRAPDLAFHVLFVFGPGGIGKTTFARELVRLAEQAGIPVTAIDARNLEPTPDSFLAAVGRALGARPQNSPFDVLASRKSRQIIVIDTYEALAPLDTWLREVFLPRLPDDVLVVLAGRNRPSLGWRSDPGWQVLLRPLPLRNLRPEESRAYLVKRALPVEQHQVVLGFTHGHPLALSLVADVFAQRKFVRFQPEAAPDVVKMLLGQLVEELPGPAHRSALEACALVRLMTEPLLSDMLGLADTHGLFEWLRGLSFIESGRHGIFPHDLTREAIVADLRWRNPQWYADLHRRAGAHYAARLHQASPQEQEQILFDYIFLHRDNPVVRPFFDSILSSGDDLAEPTDRVSLFVDSMHDSDRPALISMVERHEGAESARLAEYWLARQPQGVLIVRNAERQLEGFLAMVALQETTADDAAIDPAIHAAMRYLQAHGPTRPSEKTTIFRFWMARETYQAISAVQGLAFVHMVRHYLTTPGLAFTLLPCAEPEVWSMIFAYADLHRLADADFEVGGRRYGCYGHDWRIVPPMSWLALLAEREVSATPPGPPPARIESLVVLSQPDFAAAVRAALRDFHRPLALRGNPLLRSRLIVERIRGNLAADRVAVLQDVIKEACALLQATPRQAKLYRALYHTYLQPAATQEQAAEILDLPFSTYRRHLKAGISRLTETLWHWEVEGIDSPAARVVSTN